MEIFDGKPDFHRNTAARHVDAIARSTKRLKHITLLFPKDLAVPGDIASLIEVSAPM
jgi:hypothetical protein